MAKAPKPFTIEEMVELNNLELASRGETRDDVTRHLRSRLRDLRAGKSSRSKMETTKAVSLESRLAVLEKEVKRLARLVGRRKAIRGAIGGE